MIKKNYAIRVIYNGTGITKTIFSSSIDDFDKAVMVYLNLYRKWGSVKNTSGSIIEYGARKPIEEWNNIYHV